jgi:uncharacterized membrane protein
MIQWLAALRLSVGIATGVVVGIVALVAGAPWVAAVVAAWAAACVVILVWIWVTSGPMGGEATEAHARVEDFSRATAQLITLGASVGSLIGVALVLREASERHGTAKALLILLAVVSVAVSWFTVHTVFALRYSHLYYNEPQPRHGISFPGDDLPDFRDFAYLALTIGMTFQVSDTSLEAKAIRRTATRHALISYLFGAVIVALVINVVADLLR